MRKDKNFKFEKTNKSENVISQKTDFKIPRNIPKRKTGTGRLDPKLVLQALGIYSARSLDQFEAYRNARLLNASSKNEINLPELSSIVNAEYLGRPISGAATWPINALQGLSSVHASALEGAGIRTIFDLSGLGSYADQVFASGSEDNGFYEPPSAPAELLPTITGAISTSNKYSSFVRDTDLRGLVLGLNDDCIEALPLAGRSTSDEYNLGEIFTKLKCPIFYLGYMVEHQQDWVNLGTYLGDVKSSICLAPGESRQIAFLDWNRRQNLNRQEDTNKKDNLTVEAVHSRALQEVVQAVAIEQQMGGTETEANTSTLALSAVGSAALVGGLSAGVAGAGIGAGAGLVAGTLFPGLGNVAGAGIGGVVGGVLSGSIGAAAGAVYSSSQLLGTIQSASEGDREVSAELNQRITQRTSQNSGLKQSLFSTVVLDDAEAEQVQANTRNITNYNHMHSLNVMYYEVLQHYLTRTHVTKMEPLLYLPYRFMDFTGFNFIRDYWDIVREYLEDDLRAQGDSFFVDEDGPASADLLVVPPPRDPPEAPEVPVSAQIDKLVVDVFYTIGLSPLGVAVPADISLLIDAVAPPTRILKASNDSIGGYLLLDTFEFDPIGSAEDITSMVISKSQANTHTEVKFMIRVKGGNIKRGGNSLEDLKNTIIGESIIDPQRKGDSSISIDWQPVEPVDTSIFDAATEDYNEYINNRNEIIAKNRIRQAAYDELVANLPRVKARLQSVIQRKRHFFTRVILNAMEPEQIKGLLDALHVSSSRRSEENSEKIPLHAIAHTQPIGMSAGSFVLRLKRFTPESAARLSENLGLTTKKIGPRVLELLEYNQEIQEMESDYNNTEPVTTKDSTGHVYLPTGGLFAEAILGRSNSAEYLDMERYFNWNDSPIPHQPPAIGTVNMDSRNQDIAISPTDLKTPLTVVNAPNFPEPSGMKDVLAAIQNGNMFRDMSKAEELAGILKNLMSLSEGMGKSASGMTGAAARDAMASAVKMGETASEMTEKLFDQTMKQTGTAFKSMTEKGAAIGATKKNLSEDKKEDAITDILGIPRDTETTGSGVPDAGHSEDIDETTGNGGTAHLAEDADFSNLATTKLPALPEPGETTQARPQVSEASRVFEAKANTLLQQSEALDETEFVAIVLEWYQDSVLPRLKQASNDDRFLISALNDWLEWVRWLGNFSNLGLSNSSEIEGAEDEAKIWVEGGLQNAVLQSRQRAIDTNKIEYFKDAIDWAIYAEIWGFSDENNRLDPIYVIEDFPIRIDLFNVQYPPEVAEGVPTTFSATAALKIADNDPVFKPSLSWKIMVSGGSVSGLTEGSTNSSGGFSTVINRTLGTGFQIILEINYIDRLRTYKFFNAVYTPGLP